MEIPVPLIAQEPRAEILVVRQLLGKGREINGEIVDIPSIGVGRPARWRTKCHVGMAVTNNRGLYAKQTSKCPDPGTVLGTGSWSEADEKEDYGRKYRGKELIIVRFKQNPKL